MTELAPQTPPADETEQRSQSIRALLLTLVMTPLLVIPDPVRNIVSMEATVTAGIIGIVAGIGVSLALGRVQFSARNDLRTTLVAFASTGIVTVSLWVLLPTELLQIVPHFGIAFLWSFSLVSVTRDVVWPAAADLLGS